MIRNKAKFYPVIVLFLIALTIWFANQFAQQMLVKYLETYISPDRDIKLWQLAVARIYLMLFNVGIIWIVLYEQIKRREYWIQLWTQTGIRNKIAYGLGLVLVFSGSVAYKSTVLYKEGVLEYLTVIFLLYASLLVFWSVKKNSSGYKRIYLFGIGLALFVLGMEEISWGQTIFGWDSPSVFAGINYQNETNIHNLFNPIFPIAYSFVCLVLGYVLVNIGNLKLRANYSKPINEALALLPTNKLSFWGFMFLLFSLLNLVHLPFSSREITEEVFSVFSVAYALEVLDHTANSTNI